MQLPKPHITDYKFAGTYEDIYKFRGIRPSIMPELIEANPFYAHILRNFDINEKYTLRCLDGSIIIYRKMITNHENFARFPVHCVMLMVDLLSYNLPLLNRGENLPECQKEAIEHYRKIFAANECFSNNLDIIKEEYLEKIYKSQNYYNSKLKKWPEKKLEMIRDNHDIEFYRTLYYIYYEVAITLPEDQRGLAIRPVARYIAHFTDSGEYPISIFRYILWLYHGLPEEEKMERRIIKQMMKLMRP